MSVQLEIKMVQASRQFSINADLTNTVAELKEQISGEAGVEKDSIRLVCAGKMWQDVSTVGSYEPKDGSIVHCLNNPARATPAASEQTLSAVNPMQAMMGGGGAPAPAAAGDDPFAQMMAQSQQMMAQNPEMMQQLMASPMVEQMMSNPETMRAMMRMNPRMEQLMEQRPEIARMLEDPDVMRQSMQMIRNPSLMREMQRNQDLSIGRLDAMPGGHDALVRAHEDMLDPLMNALSGSGAGGGSAVDVAAYEQQGQAAAPNSEALPNPWGAPAPAASPVPAAAQAPTAATANPFAAMMAGGTPQAGAPQQAGGNTNPMAAMMQQMMSNPAMMQQSMQMAQQMGMGGMATLAESQTNPAPATPANPFAAMMAGGAPQQAGGDTNPMAAMMQQMMSNPAMMQQSMQMAQQMGLGGMGMGNSAEPQTTPANPFAAMMAGGQPQTGAVQQAGSETNPMAAIMQQMMSNPAMLQQAMQMRQQMGMGGMGMGLPQPGGAQQAGGNPNPMAAMMQQMMSNPAMMQQSMQMAQQMGMGGMGMGAQPGAGAGYPNMFGAQNQIEGGEPVVQDDAVLRAQFATQLSSLAAMGFCNEAACLRALQQHQGRIDGAIDALLSAGDATA